MPNISNELIKSLMETLDSYSCGAHHPDLLLLLAQPEVEPVAHMYPWDLERFATNETMGHAYSVAVGCADGVSVPLYTHPVPFTPITADMVTDEMVAAFKAPEVDDPVYDTKGYIAAAVNAWGAKQ